MHLKEEHRLIYIYMSNIKKALTTLRTSPLSGKKGMFKVCTNKSYSVLIPVNWNLAITR